MCDDAGGRRLRTVGAHAGQGDRAGDTGRHRVAGAAVTFMPHAGGRPATGVTDAEGRYRLTTISSDDGALLGSYSVSIAKTEMPAASADKFGLSGAAAPQSGKPHQLLPVRYARAEDSGLTREVKPGSNEFDFDLTEATN